MFTQKSFRDTYKCLKYGKIGSERVPESCDCLAPKDPHELFEEIRFVSLKKNKINELVK